MYQQCVLIIHTDFHIRTRPCCKRSILRCASSSKLTVIEYIIFVFKVIFAGLRVSSKIDSLALPSGRCIICASAYDKLRKPHQKNVYSAILVSKMKWHKICLCITRSVHLCDNMFYYRTFMLNKHTTYIIFCVSSNTESRITRNCEVPSLIIICSLICINTPKRGAKRREWL